MYIYGIKLKSLYSKLSEIEYFHQSFKVISDTRKKQFVVKNCNEIPLKSNQERILQNQKNTKNRKSWKKGKKQPALTFVDEIESQQKNT